MNDTILLEMKNIHKRFTGVYALKGVNLELLAGEVHALLGENGAGKSTLIKILGGIYSKDQGEIIINGISAEISNVNQARANGVSIIHQELVLVPHLTVAENIFLGAEPMKNGYVDFNKMYEMTDKLLNSMGLNFSADAEVGSLTIAQQQMVEVVKAISFNSKIIVMDEPTSSLSDKEVDALFERIRLLTKQGVGIIYISHRMSELQQIADRVTVLRDGEFIATKVVKETSNDELIALMVGREITNYYTRTFNSYDEVVLKVENLCSPVVSNVSFELKKGEILGFAGLIGAGRSEAMKAIFGIDSITSGSIYLNGEKLTIQKPSDALKHGICLVPEDRKMEGIFPIQSIKFNSTLKVLDKFIKGIHVNYTKEDDVTDEYMKNLSIKAPDSNYLVGSLSGGNQQKVVLASWLATNPKVLIMDEPTRGIDVHAKSEIYAIMNELAKSGISIIMVSSELPEVLNMSDRIIVMSEGKITALYDRHEATQEKIMQYAVKM